MPDLLGRLHMRMNAAVGADRPPDDALPALTFPPQKAHHGSRMRTWAAIFSLVIFGLAARAQEAAPSATNPPPAVAATTNAPVRVIPAEILHELLRLTNDFVLIDVMSPLYYRDFHIKGAMSIPEPELAETVSNWPRGRRIVVYCLDKECDTSRIAARTLMLMGFRDVLQYEGGKREWRDKKFEAVGKGKLLD